MNRRKLISLIGAAAAWPLAARAQRSGKPVAIGFLGTISPQAYAKQLAAFRQGLRDLGYVEGVDISVEYRWAENDLARLPDLLADLIRTNVAVIVTHGTQATLAAKRATNTIPIVTASVGDPVLTGVVKSIARPDGNVTGQSFFNPELRAKRIELLKEVMPSLSHVAVLFNRESPATGPQRNEKMAVVANSLKIRLQNYLVGSPGDFEVVFDKIVQAKAGAVEVGDNALIIANVERLAAMATKRRLLSIGPKEFAQAGGLIGFGVDFPAAFHRVSAFVDKILKGAKPADLPFEQASKFEFVINLKTAKAVALEVPAATLLRADEVIE